MNAPTRAEMHSVLLPDLVGLLRSWTETRLPFGDASLPMAREALRAQLQAVEWATDYGGRWARLACETASRHARLAQAASAKAAAAEDAQALWSAGFEWLGEALDAHTDSMQQGWAAFATDPSGWWETLASQGGQSLHRWLDAFSALPTAVSVRIDPASEAPVVAAEGLGPWLQWMNEASKAARSVAQAPWLAAGNATTVGESGA